MTDENKNIYVAYWLLLITFLVIIMIVIGGLTRLTESGLSITKWDLISGILPPLSSAQWDNQFSLYKQIPEYKLLNAGMTLEQFKTIYWWEYIHRLLGRIVGIVYILPFFYFLKKNLIKKENFISLCLILILIVTQGIVGWYMVKSGLTDRTDVSHYRLSLHLTLAFIIFIMLFWNYLNYTNIHIVLGKKKLPYNLPIIFLFILICQISIGAFVSGLDAGKIYQTWPLMNGNYFPDDSDIKNLFSLNSFESPSVVQFIHRNMAYLLFLFISIILIITFMNKDFFYLRKSAALVFIILIFQMMLGILTIKFGVQIFLASTHQIGSIFLILSCLLLVYKNYKTN